jgi:hypothetical protein
MLGMRKQRMRSTLGLVGVAVTATLMTGCASRNQTRSPFDGPGAPGGSAAEDPIHIEIQNLSFNDITVWAVRSSGQRTRVTRVTGKTDRRITIGWNVAIPISFYVEQTAGRSCRTVEVGVEPNARVWLSVPSNVGTQACRAGRR